MLCEFETLRTWRRVQRHARLIFYRKTRRTQDLDAVDQATLKIGNRSQCFCPSEYFLSSYLRDYFLAPFSLLRMEKRNRKYYGNRGDENFLRSGKMDGKIGGTDARGELFAAFFVGGTEIGRMSKLDWEKFKVGKNLFEKKKTQKIELTSFEQL